MCGGDWGLSPITAISEQMTLAFDSFGLTLVAQLGRMVYLAYMQDPNAADKVKIMFQNLKHSTATIRQKKQL